MKTGFFSRAAILILIAAIFSCGDNTDLFPSGDRYKIDFVSLSDGDVLVRPASERSGTFIFFRLRGDENKSASLILITDLLNDKGEVIAHHEKTQPAVNADSPIDLSSQLPLGLYSLELTLKKGDTFLAREKRTFFIVRQAQSIQGILSYPLLILPARTALLMADMNEPAGLDPYFKWTQGKKMLAKGLLSEGYSQILWESPEEDGVYSVKVEAFPFPPPAGVDFEFASAASATAELFISPPKKENNSAPEAEPQYTLFAIYIRALRERERHGATANFEEDAVPRLKQPRPVILGEAIGMKFDGLSGFTIPELILPVRSRNWEASLSLGISFEGAVAGRRILSLNTADKAVSLECAFNEEGELLLVLNTKAAEIVFPSGIKKVETGSRSLIDLSLRSADGRWRVAWKRNGSAVTEIEKAVVMDPGDRTGRTVVGGVNGARCIIDTLDVVLR